MAMEVGEVVVVVVGWMMMMDGGRWRGRDGIALNL
jgi:hypothetical protein